LALPKSLTYKYVSSEEPMPGMRVVVPLKGKKLYTGFIWKVHNLLPTTYEVKYLLEVVDQTPFLSESRMRYLEWMSSYYCCTLGEVLAAAVPSPFRLSSESYIQIHPDFAWQKEDWESEEHWIFASLQKNPKMPLSDLLKALGNMSRWMKKIRQWQVESKILIFDELMDRYRPRMETFISLNPNFRTDDALDALFVEFTDKPQEESLMLKFLSKTRFGQLGNQGWHINKESFPMTENEKKTLAKLTKKGILQIEKTKLDPYAGLVSKEFVRPKLSPAQSQAILEIEE
jgi:primosomal protein N' (replication factor Y)